MKRIGILAIVVGIVFAFSAVCSFAADETGLKVTAKNGTVRVKIYPSDKWADLNVGQMVHLKDTVKTDPCDAHSKGGKYTDDKGNLCPLCGAATLELSDKSSVSLKPGTEISIDELVMNNAARKLKVNMPKGELRMIVAKVGTPSDFSVKTPNAIYGATGTLFYVSATASGTSVYVADGSIIVVDPLTGTTYTVTAGMTMTFNADGTVTGPTPASDVDVSNWTACYTPTAEPYTPADLASLAVNPPGQIGERGISGG